MKPGWIERPEVRQAVQSVVGVGAAIAAGTAISGRRWYWAVIAAFIIALGVGSRGEASVKALQRVGGTLLGVVVGIGLATAVSGHTVLAYALALVCAFFAYYAFQAAYGAMIFFITLMLSLLYGLLGQFKPELLLLRLEETAAGAVIGVAATFLILPIRQSEAFQTALDAYLDALARALSPQRTGDPSAALADLQTKTQDLRNAHGAFKRGWAALAHPAYRDTIRAAMLCTYLAREWLAADRPWDPEAQTKPLAQRAARRLARAREGTPLDSDGDSGQLPAGADSYAVESLAALGRGVAKLARACAALRQSR